MLDKCKRKIDYLRISITDRCNLRCIYCMPEEGIPMASHEDILSYDEIIRICQIAVTMGISKIKITGGEPLVRKDALVLIKEIKSIKGIEKVTLTTNGILLGKAVPELVKYKIDGINVSLDTLDKKLFSQITRFDMLDQVREGIHKVLEHPEIPLKINCVPMNLPEQNLINIAALAKDHKLHVRFIEMMPIGYGQNFEYLSEQTMIALLTEAFGPLSSYGESLGNGPCRYYQLPGFQGKIGFISALSHQFCDSCNRVRLTSQGFLKACLQYETGKDLRVLLRNGAEDKEIAAAMQECIQLKPKGHAFLNRQFNGEQENQLSMSKIGG
ncbi:MAG: GTP 3',8-cyclase MoaA [Lachnospiraceae bacterium]